MEKRWKEILQYWQKESPNWLIIGLLIGIAIGFVFGYYGRFIWEDELIQGFLDGFWAEALGILITIGVIERIISHRNREEYKRQLIRQARSRSNDVALGALEELEDRGWLLGDDSILKNQNLRGANWENAKLRGINLSGADLSLANLTNCDLSNSDLTRARLEHSELQNTVLWECNLNFANICEAKLTNVKMGSVSLRDAILDYSIITDSYMAFSDLVRASIIGAEIRNVDLSNSILDEAMIQGAEMSNVDLSNSSLANTKIRGKTPLGFRYTGLQMKSSRLPDDKPLENLNRLEDLLIYGCIIEADQ